MAIKMAFTFRYLSHRQTVKSQISLRIRNFARACITPSSGMQVWHIPLLFILDEWIVTECVTPGAMFEIFGLSLTTEMVSCTDPEGGRGSGPPPPPWKIAKIGFLSNTGPDPLKITKIPSLHSMLSHHRPAIETPFNGVSLAGRWWPTMVRV